MPPHPATAVFYGDINAEAGSDEYRAMVAPFADETPAPVDAWGALNGETPHPPTCDLFDREQWPQGPHCRDYFFVTGDLVERLDGMAVNTGTTASDHQPIQLRLRSFAPER